MPMSDDDELTYVPIGDGFMINGWSDDDDDECYIGLRVAALNGIVITFPIDAARTLIAGIETAIKVTETAHAERLRKKRRTNKTTPSA